jgi:polyhydroxyalkanoate synthesis regulator phasin
MNEAYQLSEKILSEGNAKILEMKSTILEQSEGEGGEQASLEFLLDPETGQIRADASISPANAWSAAIVAVGGTVTVTAIIISGKIAIAALAANPVSAAIVMTIGYLEARIFVDAIFKGISVLEKYGNKILSTFGVKIPGLVKRFFQKIKGNPAKKAEQKIRDSINKMIKTAKLSEDEAKMLLIAVMEKIKSNEAYLELARDLAEAIAKNDLEKTEEISNKINALNMEIFQSLTEDALELANAADEIRDKENSEEELAMVAESKQYNRWKSIAGVNK